MENDKIRNEKIVTDGKKPLETNSAEIVRRHLEDENHEITDEEIRNVKVGTTDDEPVTIGAEAKARLVGDESETAAEDENDEGTNASEPKAKPGTPWDVLSE